MNKICNIQQIKIYLQQLKIKEEITWTISWNSWRGKFKAFDGSPKRHINLLKRRIFHLDNIGKHGNKKKQTEWSTIPTTR